MFINRNIKDYCFINDENENGEVVQPYMEIEKYEGNRKSEKSISGHNNYPITTKVVYGYNYRLWCYYYYYYYCFYYYKYYNYYRMYYDYYNRYYVRRYIYDYYIKHCSCMTVDLGTEYLDPVNISINNNR